MGSDIITYNPYMWGLDHDYPPMHNLKLSDDLIRLIDDLSRYHLYYEFALKLKKAILKNM